MSSEFGLCHWAPSRGLALWLRQSKSYRFETPKPHPRHGKPPIEVLVPDTSRDSRAGRALLAPRRAPRAPKCARRTSVTNMESPAHKDREPGLSRSWSGLLGKSRGRASSAAFPMLDFFSSFKRSLRALSQSLWFTVISNGFQRIFVLENGQNPGLFTQVFPYFLPKCNQILSQPTAVRTVSCLSRGRSG